MTTDRRLDRDLPDILGDLAAGPTPDYIEDVLRTTAGRRQRPAWTSPERWLPMTDFARQPVLASRVPWRVISIAMIVIALVLVVAAIVAGGAQPRFPAPFGLARNGLIAYEVSGDIYTGDPITGATTAIVAGPATDVGPRFSRDGTRIVFERKVDRNLGQLYTARSDGTDLTLVTPEPVQLSSSVGGEPWAKYEFSPDGTTILIAAELKSPTILVAQSDGSGVRQIDVGMAATEPSFRPPNGAEIMFVGSAGMNHGIFAVNVASGAVRPVVEPPFTHDLAGATWSPDGSMVAYWSWQGIDGIDARTHVVLADGTGDRELPAPPDAVWNAGSAWSNDGTRLLVVRGYTTAYDDVRPAVVPADGNGSGTALPFVGTINGECCATWAWSADDSRILGTPVGTQGQPLQQVILDPTDGTTEAAPWTSTSRASWQRRAP